MTVEPMEPTMYGNNGNNTVEEDPGFSLGNSATRVTQRMGSHLTIAKRERYYRVLGLR